MKRSGGDRPPGGARRCRRRDEDNVTAGGAENGGGSNVEIEWPLLIGKDYRSRAGIPFTGKIGEIRLWIARDSQGEDGTVGRWFDLVAGGLRAAP